MGYEFIAGSFWIFLAAVVVAGIWSDIRTKEAKEKTTQKLIEHGKDLKPEDLEKLIGISETDQQDLAMGLKVAGLITLFISPGLAIFGWFLGATDVFVGIALLVLCVSLGLMTAAKFVKNSESNSNQL